MTNTTSCSTQDLQKYLVIAPVEGTWWERMHIVCPAVVAGGGRCIIPKCSLRVGRVTVPYAALFQLLKCVF